MTSILTDSDVVTGIANDTEIRFFGQKRCGHHAVIGWLITQLEGPTYYFNDCIPFADPFRSHTNTPPFVTKYPSLVQHGSFGRDAAWVPGASVAGETRLIQTLRTQKKQNVVFSFEDFELDKYQENIIPVRYAGASRRRLNVIMLRDPFNMLASQIKVTINSPNVRFDYEQVVRNWKIYARECLGLTNYVPYRMCILYNRWFVSRAYRDEICASVGIVNSDVNFQMVPPNGRGSSFDGQTLDGKAQEMRVLERWKEFCSHPDFLWAAHDQELVDYSERLFGKIM